MAAFNFNSEHKAQSYRVLARLNISFGNIIYNLDDLEEAGAFDSKSLSTFAAYAKELQSLINCKLLSAFSALEEKHAFEFGKVRIAREHYLNPNRPAFTERKKPKK